MRIGNDEYAVTNDSYGLTTIEDDHATVSGTRLELKFGGKSGVDVDVVLHDRRLTRIVQQCQELPGEDLFQYLDGDRVCDVTSTHVNDYLRSLTGGDRTAKDFRTWGGTVVVARTLAGLSTHRNEREASPNGREADRNVIDAIDAAAARLRNTRTVCRNCYVHPRVPAAYLDGSLDDAWRASRASTRMDRAESAVLKVLAGGG